MKESDKPSQGEGAQELVTQTEREATATTGWGQLRAWVPAEVWTTAVQTSMST